MGADALATTTTITSVQPVKLATTSIQRGAVNLDTGASAARLGREGAVEIDRGAVTEVLENRDDGVEQSWRFAADPGGDDDLVVTVAVTGYQTVATTRTGLHFLNGDRLGIAYSHAMWVDATRTSWTVPVSWDGQQVVIRVPSSVLDRSVYPAVLDPDLVPHRPCGGADAAHHHVGDGGGVGPLAWERNQHVDLRADHRSAIGAGGDVG